MGCDVVEASVDREDRAWRLGVLALDSKGCEGAELETDGRDYVRGFLVGT